MLANVYDSLVQLLAGGRADTLRRATLAAGNLGSGDDVLEVGCGTATLAIRARTLVGACARVTGVDVSASMLAQARRNADRAGVRVELTRGRAERLPLSDASFDVVLLSLVLHSLPPDGVGRAIGEAHRVLRAGGRVVVVEFRRGTGPVDRLKATAMLHGHVAAAAADPGRLLTAGGFAAVVSHPSPLSALGITAGTRTPTSTT